MRMLNEFRKCCPVCQRLSVSKTKKSCDYCGVNLVCIEGWNLETECKGKLYFCFKLNKIKEESSPVQNLKKEYCECEEPFPRLHNDFCIRCQKNIKSIPKSSPVHNLTPKRSEVSLCETNPKKCTCKWNKLNPDYIGKKCVRCGGVL